MYTKKRLGRPPLEEGTHRVKVALSCSPAERAMLRALAKRKNMTLSAFVLARVWGKV